mmetsp:Transcript_17444/g.57124  ORF Transcript_17444/g.57124 Transcript_17444/m.57124 type:complete len:267 (-) Transcript_17444:619-1419(-)
MGSSGCAMAGKPPFMTARSRASAHCETPNDAMSPSSVPRSASRRSTKVKTACLVVPGSTVIFIGWMEKPRLAASSDRPSKLTSRADGLAPASPALMFPKVRLHEAVPSARGTSSRTTSSASAPPPLAAAAADAAASSSTSCAGAESSASPCSPDRAGGSTYPPELHARPERSNICVPSPDTPPAMASSNNSKKCRPAWSGEKVSVSLCTPPAGIAASAGSTSNAPNGPRLAWPRRTLLSTNLTAKSDSLARSTVRVSCAPARTSPK